jgi:hypothetical protein
LVQIGVIISFEFFTKIAQIHPSHIKCKTLKQS